MRASLAITLGVLGLPLWAEDLPERAAVAPPVRVEQPAVAEATGCATPATSFEPVAEAQDFSVGDQILRAIVTRPKDADPRATAVLLHGYQGSRDEFPVAGGAGLFERTALTMARAGIASVRFDFRGTGVSDGAWADTTFGGQTEDALAVLAALDAGPVHLLGFSQGGLVALQVAAEREVASVTLWNPVLDPFQTYGRIFGDSVVQAGIAAARDGGAGPVAGTGLNAAFFGDIDLADPPSSAASFAGPILIVTGRQDRLAANGPANAAGLAALRDGPTRTLVVEAGHTLGATDGLAIVDRVIACSIAFMLEHTAPGTPDLGPLQ